FCLKRYINVYVINSCVGEEPHYIVHIKIITFHNFNSIAFHSFQKNKLIHTHLPGNVCKKSERQFHHWMKAYEAANPRVHFFNRQCGMATSKCMNPPAFL